MNKLEKLLSQTYLSRHFVSFGYSRTGTVSLLRSLDEKKNSEILVPAFTCVSIPMAIRKAGWIPIAVDSEKESLNMSADEARKQITGKTRAIYIVHTYGIPADMERIMVVAREFNLFVIEDIAHALICEYKSKLLGEWGDAVIVCLSKQMINTGGGLVGVKDEQLKEKIVQAREINYSFSPLLLPQILSYKAIRLLASGWYGYGSLVCLALLNFLDFLNHLLPKARENLDGIFPWMYKMWPLESRLACGGLKKLKAKKHEIEKDYLEFYKRIEGKAQLPINRGNLMVTYWGASLNTCHRSNRKSKLLKILSFRGWKNYHKLGKYPNAEEWFDRFRVFSKFSKLLK